MTRRQIGNNAPASPECQSQVIDLNGIFGRELASRLATELNVVLRKLPGEELLVIGNAPLNGELDSTHLRRVYHMMGLNDELARLGELQNVGADETLTFVGDGRGLPLADDSLSSVLLNFGLDGTSNPHRLIAEVGRVVAPGGHVVITGFNPWSGWGAWRLIHELKTNLRGGFGPISKMRLMDWLALLGFRTWASFYVMCPILGRYRSSMTTRATPMGAAYVVAARRQSFAGTPLSTDRAHFAPVVGSPFPKPTTRQP